jgi:nifR3 family TIM-barrel protein
MRDLDNALRLIEATISATSVPVTLKMRLGWDDKSHNAAELARRAEDAGIAMVTVHGRTRCQFFTGEADWAAVRPVAESVKIPVVVNGDIESYEAAEMALRASGADAVMIGRGAQGRPWLPGFIGKYLATGERSSDPPLAEQLHHLIELYEATLLHYGVKHGLRHARKHLSWGLNVAAHFAGVAPQVLGAWRSKVLTAETPDAATGHLSDAYACFSWRSAA